MAFDLAEAKREARQAVHDTLAVDATYEDASTAEPVDIKVRWHNKIVQAGDLQGDGYTEILANVDRLVFDRAALADLGLIPVRGARVVIAGYGDAAFKLDTRDPIDGPVTVTWTVVRDREAA